MASLYIFVVVAISVYIDISPLNVYHNPVFNNQCLYLCFWFEHMPSFDRPTVHCCCSVITQSFLLSFTSSSCLSPWDISLVHQHSHSQFPQCTFPIHYLRPSKKESPPSVDCNCPTILLQVMQWDVSANICSDKKVLVSEQDLIPIGFI